MRLIHGIDGDRFRRASVSGFGSICRELNILVIAEGVETPEESALLLDQEIEIQQGYLFARPMFQGFAVPSFA